MLHSLRSFGSHKSPKIRKKNGKERNVPFKERKRTERTEQKRTRCPTLQRTSSVFDIFDTFLPSLSFKDSKFTQKCLQGQQKL